MKKGDKIRVYLSAGIVEAIVVEENEKTVWVQLPDGNIIKRHKEKHIAKKEVVNG